MKDESQLLGSLDFIGREARHLTIDAVHCELFNLSGSLLGNTPDSDVDWLARTIFGHVGGDYTNLAWEALPDSDKEWWLKVTSAAIDRLPDLMSRIAHRMQHYAKTLEALSKAERRQLKESEANQLKRKIEVMQAKLEMATDDAENYFPDESEWLEDDNVEDSGEEKES